MSQDDFLKHLAKATEIVDKWPAWKQNILQNSSRPTVAMPRLPVDNMRSPEEDNQSKSEK